MPMSKRTNMVKRSDIVTLVLVFLVVIAGIGGLGIVTNRIKLTSPRPTVSQPQQPDHAPNPAR
jgi:hypothetical protein